MSAVRSLLLDYLRGPVRDAAWVAIGAVIGGSAAVVTLTSLLPGMPA